jgi:predicted AlkP superfamily phosphohydrolase/phosphomutase
MAAPVLAIGVDAVEPAMVRRLAADGSLPNIRALAGEGAWHEVQSPADLGSAAVWPTFVTASAPEVHGVYCDWMWDPDRMEIRKWTLCEPFWARLGSELRVGALDVPLAAATHAPTAFEIVGWGARLELERSAATIAPEPVAAIVDAHDPHPFAARHGLFPGPRDAAGSARVDAACLEGIRRRGRLARSLIEATRPDLALVVFTEVHEAGHRLWHTAEPASPLYKDLGPSPPGVGGIERLLREVDAEIGRLVELVGSDAPVAIFALDGMGPARGVPAFLGPVLRERRWAVPPARRPGQARGVARGGLAWAKRRSPITLRRAYHALVPESTRWRVAQKSSFVPDDWSRTRAFALPTNQHGWVRINLRGRERDGIVAPGDYEPMRDELAAELAELETDDGRALVKRVVVGGNGAGPSRLLPDLILHWTEAAYDRPVRVAGTSVEAMPSLLELTGTHRLDAFCLARGLPVDGQPLRAERLPEVLISAASA